MRRSSAPSRPKATGIAELLDAIESIGTHREPASRQGAAPASQHRPSRHRRQQSRRRASPFYESLGLAVTHRETVAAEKVDVAMLPAGDSRIELLEPSAPDSPIAKFLEKRGPGLHHVALRVPDLDAAGRTAASRRRAAAQRTATRRGRPPLRLRPSRLHRRRATRTDSGERTLKAEIGIIGGSGLYSHARLRSAGRGRSSTRPSAARRTTMSSAHWPAARWRSWRATAAAIASRPRS